MPLIIRQYIDSLDRKFLIEGEVETFKASFPEVEFDNSVLNKIKENFLGAVQSNRANIFLMSDNNKLKGYISLSVQPFIDRNEIGYIESIYVKPEYRRQKIATKLMQFSQEYFLEQNINNIQLDVSKINEEATKFYESLGFEVTRYRFEKKIDL